MCGVIYYIQQHQHINNNFSSCLKCLLRSEIGPKPKVDEKKKVAVTRSILNLCHVVTDDYCQDDTDIVKAEIRQTSGGIAATTHNGGASREISGTTIYESTREVVAHKYAGDATHTSEIDTETDRFILLVFLFSHHRFRDARAILERNIKLNSDGSLDGEKVYRGLAGYKNFISKDISQVGSNKYTG